MYVIINNIKEITPNKHKKYRKQHSINNQKMKVLKAISVLGDVAEIIVGAVEKGLLMRKGCAVIRHSLTYV